MTIDDIEASNLIDHIHKPSNITAKRSLLPFDGLFNFLFGTANDDDVRSMKQDVQKLHDNQVTQSKVLNDVIPVCSQHFQRFHQCEYSEN